MSETAVISARVPLRDAELYRDQAYRYGLSTSRALGLLARGALAVDQQAARVEAPRSSRENEMEIM